MITLEIEKEIKNENKIIMGFTMRQAVTFGAVLVILVLEYLLIRPSSNILIISGIALGSGAYYLSFHKKNGMNMEYFLIKKVKQYVLMNNSRKYRTKNGYVRILNEAYRDDRNKDMSDRRKRKRLKKRERQGRWKKTRMVPYK